MFRNNTDGLSASHPLIISILFALGIVLLVADVYFVQATVAIADDLPTRANITVCGDAIVSPSEVCDLGRTNNIGIYASSTASRSCSPDCQSFGPYCGDGILQVRFGEECDDGNNVSGDLCSADCKSETAVPPSNSGSPTVGAIPSIPGAPPGVIPAITPTKVILRGKAYPNASVTVLLDGKTLGSTQADANADFLFTTTNVTPGVSSFGFLSQDVNGIASITTSAIFDVVQSAITTVSNIFLPPTIAVNNQQVAPGDLLVISGESVPFAKIVTDIFATSKTTLSAEADETGLWALQVDTKSLTEGNNTAKAIFQISNSIKSGYGRSVSFTVGNAPPAGSCGKPDINGDGKVNLVDFSIFLLSWDTSDAKADFNCDNHVNLADFSIMLFNWTG